LRKLRPSELLLEKRSLANHACLRVADSPLERVSGKTQDKRRYTNSSPQKDASRNLSSASNQTQDRVLINEDIIESHRRSVCAAHPHFPVKRHGRDAVLITLSF